MQNRFAGQPARMGAVAGHVFTRVNGGFSSFGKHLNRTGGLIGFSAFQWSICLLVAVLALVVGCSLLSIRNNTVALNINLRDNTKAVIEMRTDLLKSADVIDRKIAETNQKLFDLAVELDDIIAGQKKLRIDEAAPAADPKQKAPTKLVGQPREATKAAALTVHRRHSTR